MATFPLVMMFGLGGILTELVKDVSFRALPLAEDDARDLIAETRAPALLGPFRGKPPADAEALVRLMVAVSRFAANCPGLDQLDLNPVAVSSKGTTALDVRLLYREG